KTEHRFANLGSAHGFVSNCTDALRNWRGNPVWNRRGQRGRAYTSTSCGACRTDFGYFAAYRSSFFLSIPFLSVQVLKDIFRTPSNMSLFRNKRGEALMGRGVLRKRRIVGVASGIASIECLLIRFIQWSSELQTPWQVRIGQERAPVRALINTPCRTIIAAVSLTTSAPERKAMERTQDQKRSLANALSVLISCLLFGREN